MSFLLNEDISSLHSSLPNSAEEMDPGQKIDAIFKQIKEVEFLQLAFSRTVKTFQTIFFYNTRMKAVNDRRMKAMDIVKDLGINNLDTRPLDRHFQVKYEKFPPIIFLFRLMLKRGSSQLLPSLFSCKQTSSRRSSKEMT